MNSGCPNIALMTKRGNKNKFNSNLTTYRENQTTSECAWGPVCATVHTEEKTSVKGHDVPHVPSFMKACCFPFPFFSTLIEHTIKTVNQKYISPLDRMFHCFKVSKKSPTNYCIDYRTERIHILITSSPLSSLYGDEKIFHVVSSCCIIYCRVALY